MRSPCCDWCGEWMAGHRRGGPVGSADQVFVAGSAFLYFFSAFAAYSDPGQPGLYCRTKGPDLHGRVLSCMSCMLIVNSRSVMNAIHVRHCAVIALSETLPIIVARVARNVRVTIFFTVFNVRRAVVVEVLPGPFHSIMKTLPLHFTKLLRRRIPVTVFLGNTRCRRSCRGAHCSCLGRSKARQRKSKHRKNNKF